MFAALAVALTAAPSFAAKLVVDDDGQGTPHGCDAATPTPYTTIQAAVTAAAAGDTIIVCPGVYNEQPLVDKAVRISGRGDATVRPSPMVDNTTHIINGNPLAAAVLVADVSGVVVEGIAVDGLDNGGAGCASNPVGIFFRNASGTVQNVAVRNIKLGPGLEGCQSGLAILVQSGAAATSAVMVLDNSVRDYQKNGITASGAGTTLTARRNRVIGIGPTPNIAQNGIQVSAGASGIVEDNTVADHVWTGCTSVACPAVSTNILLFQAGPGLIVQNNVASNTQTGIYAIGMNNGTILGNAVARTLVGDGIVLDTCNSNVVESNDVSASDDAGIFVSGEGNVISRNRINEAPIGVWNFSGTNTVPVTSVNRSTVNRFFNVEVALQTGGGPGLLAAAGAGRGAPPSPFR